MAPRLSKNKTERLDDEPTAPPVRTIDELTPQPVKTTDVYLSSEIAFNNSIVDSARRLYDWATPKLETIPQGEAGAKMRQTLTDAIALANFACQRIGVELVKATNQVEESDTQGSQENNQELPPQVS